MARRSGRSEGYKEITLQQLRSLCETVRLGSFTAAASSLGLAHPTVWKQVHALERRVGTELVEPHARGCRATEAGRALAAMASPLVTGIGSLERNFQASQESIESRLVVATSPRVLAEDLPGCLVEFERRRPQVRITLQEHPEEEILPTVEAGHADIGLKSARAHDSSNPWLFFEPCYELDIMLITLPDHPLALAPRVRDRDLCAYPLVNAPSFFGDSAVTRALERLGVFQVQPRRIEAIFASSVRRCVELGYGIGLVARVPSHPPCPHLHERSMSRYFGRLAVCSWHRKGVLLPNYARDFLGIVKEMLAGPAAGAMEAGRKPPGTRPNRRTLG